MSWGAPRLPAQRSLLLSALHVSALLASPLAASPLAAQGTGPYQVTTRPARLERGTVGLIVVHPTAPDSLVAPLTGHAAGEPLHFARDKQGAFVAVLAAPIEGSDSLVVTLVAERADGARDSLDVSVPVGAGTYRSERLRVAEQYAKPDSAAQTRIDEEIERAHEVSRASHGTPRLWRQAFRVPRPGRITSPFGTAREFNGEVVSRHLGTDFAGAVGAPVRAANAGVVALVASFYLAGTVVYLDHGEGLVTGYFHLSRAEVAAGDTVSRGQVIGRVGRTGRVTGPHLHWIARYGGITVDPTSLIRLPDPSHF